MAHEKSDYHFVEICLKTLDGATLEEVLDQFNAWISESKWIAKEITVAPTDQDFETE